MGSANDGGGGIYNNGVMTITNSTISGNQVLSFAGQASSSSGGGGIQNTTLGLLRWNTLLLAVTFPQTQAVVLTTMEQ